MSFLVKRLSTCFFDFEKLFLKAQVKELEIRFKASRVFPTVARFKANFAHSVRRLERGWKRYFICLNKLCVMPKFCQEIVYKIFEKIFIRNAFRF